MEGGGGGPGGGHVQEEWRRPTLRKQQGLWEGRTHKEEFHLPRGSVLTSVRALSGLGRQEAGQKRMKNGRTLRPHFTPSALKGR